MPRGRPRKALQQSQTAPAPTGAPTGATAFVPQAVEEVMIEPVKLAEPFEYPAGWQRGQMLNVRAMPDAVYVTLMGSEYDHAQPEKGLRFTDRGLAQDFVSWWYLREYVPR